MAMSWRAAPDGYRVVDSGLTGKLVLRGRAPGLREVGSPFAEVARWPGPLLAIETAQVAGKRSFPVYARAPARQRRQRGNLIDVQLPASRRCPVRLDLYWRATTSRQLDMEVLATTATPLEHLEVLTVSRVPCADALVDAGAADTQWLSLGETTPPPARWLVLPRDREAAAFSLDGRFPRFGEMALAAPFTHPLVLYRPAAAAWSYVEMSHPDDCARIIISRQRGQAQVHFGLFGLDLEKGVIARGRLRAVFIERRDDTQSALQLCSAFMLETPRLSV
jgi:hypothetical protein